MSEVETTAFVEAVVGGSWQATVSRLGEVAKDRSPEEVLVDYLAPAGVEVGRRWERDQLSLEDTHRATALVDACLDLLVAWNPVEPRGPSIVLASAPHDWHVLPSHMTAAALRWRGWRCDVLGAATKPVRLEERIAAGRPAAVVVSCSRVVHLPAVRTLTDTAHAHGLPVLVGGRAVTPTRALAVGADAAARTFDGAAEQLHHWLRLAPQHAAPPQPPQEAFELEALEASLVESCVTRLWEAYGASDSQRARARARDTIRGVVRAVVSSLLLDDDTVLVEELAWLRDAVASRVAVPEGASKLFADLIITGVPPDFVDTRALLERAL